MRVALNGLLLSRSFSGVEVAILNLAHALAEYGTEDYTLYVPGRFPLPSIESESVTTRRTWMPTHFRPVRILWEQLVLPRLLSRGGFDLVHSPGYLAPLLTRTPVVITVYDIIALQFPDWCTPTNRMNYGLMLPRAIRKAAGIIVPSEATRKDVIACFPAAATKTRAIPLAAGSEFGVAPDPADCEAARRRYGLPESYILFVGNLEPKKNLVRLVEAYALLRERGTGHGLVIAGSPAWGGEHLRARIRALGLEGSVVLTGVVRPEDLPCVYAMADVFAFPSLYEGFGLPPLEAMAAGVPVVASNRASLPEVTGDAAILVDPLRADAIADAIQDVLSNGELRNRLVAKGRERTRMFSWSRTARATEAFYRQVLEQRQKRT
jgi:glycosyltransferase involved in cell wall biosynthesis